MGRLRSWHIRPIWVGYSRLSWAQDRWSISIPGFDPYALVFDPELQGLGRETFVLLDHGVEVEIVTDLETSKEWLRIQHGRPGVLLLPADLEKECIERLVKELSPLLEGGAKTMVLVGELRGRSEARLLSDLGFVWFVRAPFTPEELHLAVLTALGASSWSDLRKAPRVPVSLATDVARPGGIVPARVCDISSSGLFLEMKEPPAAGTVLMVELTLGAHSMMLRGIAVHGSERETPGRERGVGIVFDQLSEKDERAIMDYVAARLSAIRL